MFGTASESGIADSPIGLEDPSGTDAADRAGDDASTMVAKQSRYATVARIRYRGIWIFDDHH